MHIVTAFEQALENQSIAQKELNTLIMKLLVKQTPEATEMAKELEEISTKVGTIIRPFTE
ncbi:hypothetical protein [Vibrio aquimaris]|uniref:Uncharacterized protein n=1 Tax=Vibrio aquimaris TaxID=2587862 RepID=A0A5P9CRI5_9VIBR|nr:hypothetical protein [Vibrio aquimaris]QFT28816.1 hypothetical protein FIV01_20655 [Vibrio aquimaris]